MTGIYYITNKENGKIYVGCSGNIEKRWEQHLEMLRSKKHHSYKLQNAYNELGEENFEMTIEEECRFEDRFLIEARHIRKNKGISNLYNVAQPEVLLDEDGEINPLTKPKVLLIQGLNPLKTKILDLILIEYQQRQSILLDEIGSYDSLFKDKIIVNMKKLIGKNLKESDLLVIEKPLSELKYHRCFIGKKTNLFDVLYIDENLDVHMKINTEVAKKVCCSSKNKKYFNLDFQKTTHFHIDKKLKKTLDYQDTPMY